MAAVEYSQTPWHGLKRQVRSPVGPLLALEGEQLIDNIGSHFNIEKFH